MAGRKPILEFGPMRNRYPLTVHLVLLQAGEVLLLRRACTGYEDGNYGLVAGHVEAGETVRRAIVREAFEEAGITLLVGDLSVVHVMHYKSGLVERVDVFLKAETWSGEVQNREPHRCDELRWFSLGELPANMIPSVRVALSQIDDGSSYCEFGW